MKIFTNVGSDFHNPYEYEKQSQKDGKTFEDDGRHSSYLF